MIKKEKTIQEVITRFRCCDVCDAKMFSNANCCICTKDLCQKCVEHIESDYSDYPDYYCKKCWDRGILFRSKVNDPPTPEAMGVLLRITYRLEPHVEIRWTGSSIRSF